jgi:3-hydroxyisobutyrate dehydrogenase
MLKAGFIGLGAMGAPMAANLHGAGLLAAVWNRTVEKAANVARDTGCRHCDSPADLAETCDIVVICVSADQDVLDLVEEMAPCLDAGDIVVDCSTVDASTARRASAQLARHDVGFLDCPVSGGTEGARRGSLSIMVGGEKGHLERARPVLDAMGSTVVHLGAAGAGQAAKATNQIMVAGINQAVTEALAFGKSQGLPMEALIEALSCGAAGNWFLSHRGPTMVQRRFPLGFKVVLHEKDLSICANMAEASGVRLPLVEMTRVHYRRLIEREMGGHDISALYILKEEMFRGTGD